MKETFRQSMAWLHTWAGLLVGWVLFFVFLTGTFGYFNAEVDRWMQPEFTRADINTSAADLLPVGLDWLSRERTDAQSWYIYLPGERGSDGLSVGWRDWPDGDARFGEFTRERLNPATGQPVAQDFVRETGGGNVLYRMHYELHYLPYDAAILIVGICTMFMFVAIISGIITHKKIFKDFFTFRPGKGQRSWLDGHNVLSVTALPFHLMITWSGLIFFLFTYMPVAADSFYPEGETRDQFYEEVLGNVNIAPGIQAPIAAMAPVAPMLAEAERRWGESGASIVRIESPNRANARVMVYAGDMGVRRTRLTLLFDGVTGELLDEGPKPGTATGHFEQVLLGLHEGRFAGPILRALYVLAGLGGTAMIATGLVLWSTKRKAKLKSDERPNFGIAAVDILNVGTIIGLPIGIAAYFWANRLIPVGLEGRGEWEVHSMFIAWGLTYVFAIWRPLDRAWLELCGIAAFAYGFTPILNALTTDRHLLNSIPQGDRVMAGFDLSAFAVGLFFLFLARKLRRKQRKSSGAEEDRAIVAAEAV